MKVKQSQRTCVECGELIPIERIEALPETYTCVRCSCEDRRLDILPDEAELYRTHRDGET